MPSPWMLYSSGVGDFCSSPPHSSEELSSDLELQLQLPSQLPQLGAKRVRQQLRYDQDAGPATEEEDEEDDEDEELSPSSTDRSLASIAGKRLRSAAPGLGHGLGHADGKAKRLLNRRTPPPAPAMAADDDELSPAVRVDVRMIDFAHTTLAASSSGSGSAASSTGTVHHGPDCGFLTGLDSLRRILMEILCED